jgi:hypothetical protein
MTQAWCGLLMLGVAWQVETLSREAFGRLVGRGRQQQTIVRIAGLGSATGLREWLARKAPLRFPCPCPVRRAGSAGRAGG